MGEDEHEEGPVCPSCGVTIALDRFNLHLEGLDGGHPECPRTDLSEVAERARAAAAALHRQRHFELYNQPFSRGWF